jgi:hypothetical protein
MLIAAAQLFAIQIGFATEYVKNLVKLDWHHHRGISFLQLGLRELNRRIYLGLAIPLFKPLPPINPKPATASLKKRAEFSTRIEFERVQVFVF